LSGSGAAMGGKSRYVQYRADLATSLQDQTPALQDVTLTYATSGDTTPPTIVLRSPAPGALDVDPASPITITFSELMNPASITTSSIKLRPAGTTNNVAATITYSGSTVVLQPTAPLAGSTTYQVVVSGIVADSTGNTI